MVKQAISALIFMLKVSGIVSGLYVLFGAPYPPGKLRAAAEINLPGYC